MIYRRISLLRFLLILITIFFSNRLLFCQLDNSIIDKKPYEQGIFFIDDTLTNWINSHSDQEVIITETPTFNGHSYESYFIYFKKKIKYPIAIYFKTHKKYIEIYFTVDKKGKCIVDNSSVDSGIAKLDNEIIKVINHSPKWSPGRLNGITYNQ